jgi:hypothetical protein
MGFLTLDSSTSVMVPFVQLVEHFRQPSFGFASSVWPVSAEKDLQV